MQWLVSWVVLAAVFVGSLAWVLPRGMRNAFDNTNVMMRRAGITLLALSSIGLFVVSLLMFEEAPRLFALAVVGVIASSPVLLVFGLVLVLFGMGIWLDRSPKRCHSKNILDMTLFTSNDFVSSHDATKAEMSTRLTQISSADGRLLMCSAPGRRRNGEPAPNMEQDLAHLTQELAPRKTAAVCLIEEREMVAMGYADALDRYRNANVEPIHFPIRDKWTAASMKNVHELVHNEVIPRLERGEGVVVHCFGGMGRAGTVAATTLVALGVHPLRAILRIKRKRPGALKSPLHWIWVTCYYYAYARPNAHNADVSS